MSKRMRRASSVLALAGLPALAAAATPAAPATPVTAVTYIDVIPDQFKAGNEAKAQGLLRRMDAQTQGEPGLVSFSVLQETGHGNHFTLLEVWRDPQSLAAHAQAAHTRQFRAELQPLIGSPYLTLVTTPAY